MALASDREVTNPLKALFNWCYSPGSPLMAPVPRPEFHARFAWAQLETAAGVYDFSVIEQRLAALTSGQRFSPSAADKEILWSSK